MLIECRVSKLSIFYSKPPLLFLAWEADCPSDPFHGFLIPFPSAQPDIWIQIAWKENLLTTKYCLISRYLDICIFKHYQVWSDIRALVIDFSIFPPSIDISTHILSLDNTNIKGTLTFLFCWRERERVFTMERQTSWIPPREDLGRKKCLDRTDCIMQNYQEPTWKFLERNIFGVYIFLRITTQRRAGAARI